MKKEINDYVFPVEGYTDKIQVGVKYMMEKHSHLSFTIAQLRPFLQSGYPWLKSLDERQGTLLDQIIKTTLTKLIQLGKVKKVTSKVSVEPQWQWASSVAASGYTNVTSEDSVAQTEEAKKAIGSRAIGGQTLFKLNKVSIRGLTKS